MIEPLTILVIIIMAGFFYSKYAISVPILLLNIVLIMAIYLKFKSDTKRNIMFTTVFAAAMIAVFLFIFHDSIFAPIFKLLSSIGLIELTQFLILTFLIAILVKAVYILIYPRAKDIYNAKPKVIHH